MKYKYIKEQSSPTHIQQIYIGNSTLILTPKKFTHMWTIKYTKYKPLHLENYKNLTTLILAMYGSQVIARLF